MPLSLGIELRPHWSLSIELSQFLADIYDPASEKAALYCYLLPGVNWPILC